MSQTLFGPTPSARARRRLAALTVAAAVFVAVADTAHTEATETSAAAITQGVASTDTVTTEPPGVPDFDPNGVVRIASDLSEVSAGPTVFDPTLPKFPSVQVTWQQAIYGTLLHENADGTRTPDLAESVEIVSPTQVDITLREGLVFSDGTSLDADAVKFGIERNRDATTTTIYQASLGSVESIEVASPTELTVTLNAPVAGQFVEYLGQAESYIVSPTALEKEGANFDAAPVGAGPFVLKDFTRGQSITLEKSPTYWNADNIRVQELQFVNVLNGPQQVNALKSDTVDVSQVQLADLSAVEGDDAFNVQLLTAQSQFIWVQLCKSDPGLSDVRVRQALNFATDRQEMIDGVLNGLGEPAWGVYPSNSPRYVPDLENIYAYDPDRAEELLAEAGFDSLDVKVIPLPNNPLATLAAELLQAQWADVGVNVEIVASTNIVDDFYTNHLANGAVFLKNTAGLNGLQATLRGAGLTNVCGFDDPALNELFDAVAASNQDSPEGIAAWADLQTYIAENALTVNVAFVPIPTVSKTSIGGVEVVTTYARPILDYTKLYVMAGD